MDMRQLNVGNLLPDAQPAAVVSPLAEVFARQGMFEDYVLEFRNDRQRFLESSLLTCYASRKVQGTPSVLCVMTEYSSDYIDNATVKSNDFLCVNAYDPSFEWAVIPILQGASRTGGVGHFTVAFYEHRSCTLHFFDPYGCPGGSCSPSVKAMLTRCINTLGPFETFVDPRFAVYGRDPLSPDHNLQTDGFSCGYFVCHFSDQFIRLGWPAFDANFDIEVYKTLMCDELIASIRANHAHRAPDRPVRFGPAANRSGSLSNVHDAVMTPPVMPANVVVATPKRGVGRPKKVPQAGNLLAGRNRTALLSPSGSPSAISNAAMAPPTVSQTVAATPKRSSSPAQEVSKDSKLPTQNRCAATADSFQSATPATDAQPSLRRSSRIEKQLPKLKPITSYCRRKHAPWGCYATCCHHLVERHDAGSFTSRCPHCKAWLLPAEVGTIKCCSRGAVDLSDRYAVLQDKRPQFLWDLTDATFGRTSVEFMRNIRKYNSTLAVGSVTTHDDPRMPCNSAPVVRINGDISHNLSDLVPPFDPVTKTYRRCAFGQVYTLELDEAMANREEVATEQKLNAAILKEVTSWLMANNPMCAMYQRLGELYEKHKKRRAASNKPEVRFSVRIVDAKDAGAAFDPTVHPHRIELPNRKDTVVLVWDDLDGLPPSIKSVWLTDISGRLVKIAYWDKNSFAYCYPVINPWGVAGFHDGIARKSDFVPREELIVDANEQLLEDAPEPDVLDALLNPGDAEQSRPSASRKFVSLREFWRYMLYFRSDLGPRVAHFLWSCLKLADAFLIETSVHADRRELFQWEKQMEQLFGKRMTTMDAFRDIVMERARRQHPGKTLVPGKIVKMKPNFPGSPQYMQTAYANLMTVIRHFGTPTWFLTFTANPTWPEYQAEVKAAGGYPRPDLLSRIFKVKLDALITELYKGVMGKVEAVSYTIEWQKRGNPHAHILVFCKDTPEMGTPQYVDQYISAEIPDEPKAGDKSQEAEQLRRLRRVVIENMLHTCGSKSMCMKNGKCAKGFPQPFAEFTVVSAEAQTQYMRRAPMAAHAPPPVIPDDLQDTVDCEALDSDDEFAPSNLVTALPRRRPPAPAMVIVDETNAHKYGNTCEKKNGNTKVLLDNRFVVPYNPQLLLLTDAHLNVLYVGSQKIARYVCKYVTKGYDVQYLEIASSKRHPNTSVVNYNEGVSHVKARIETACEAFWRLEGWANFKLSHQVVVLPVHLEGRQPICFDPETDLDTLPKKEPTSKLLQFFALCAKDIDARSLTYDQLPMWYRWNAKTGKWQRRINTKSRLLCRVNHVNPKNAELHALRVLLLFTPGPQCFDELRFVDGTRCPTFSDAAMQRGLLDSDVITMRTIDDILTVVAADGRRRYYFAMIFVHGSVNNPQKLFDHYLDDLVPHLSTNTKNTADQTRPQRALKLLQNLEYFFRLFNTTCVDQGLEVPAGFTQAYDQRWSRRVAQENNQYGGDYDVLRDCPTDKTPLDWANSQVARLNADQKTAFDDIVAAVTADPLDSNVQRLFFLEGDGGTGKTFVYNTLIKYCAAMQKKVIAMASTGIAATLLHNGATVHSTFYIGNDVTETTESRMPGHSSRAAHLASTDLFIIDEVSMLSNSVLSYVDKVLRDITGVDEPFGRRTILLGGDWKQLAPVVPNASINEVIHTSIRMSKMYQHARELHLTQNMRVGGNQLEFVEFLSKVGHGQNFVTADGKETEAFQIPMANIAPCVRDAISFAYDPTWLASPQQYVKELCTSAILTPRVVSEVEINGIIMSRLTAPERAYNAMDKVQHEGRSDAHLRQFADCDLENLKHGKFSGMPAFELKLKVGAIVLLMRNLNVNQGLCNGTRLQVTELREDIIVCKSMTGPFAKNDVPVLITRCLFEYKPETRHAKTNVSFTRKQFPLKLAFAMTINKAQGQTLNRVSVLFNDYPAFSHGMLYVALSRVRNADSYKVVSGPPFQEEDLVQNIVWPQLLRR